MTISEVYPSFHNQQLLPQSKKTQTEYKGIFFGRSGFVTLVGDLPMELVGLDHLVQWSVLLRDKGLQPRYINHCLSSFRMFLKWLSQNECRVMDWRRVVFVKEPQHKPRFTLSPAEVDTLVACAKTPRDKAIITLFFNSGFRSAELIGLDRYDWEGAQYYPDLKLWEIYVEGKNKKYRPVCFYADAKHMVDAYLETRTDRFKPLFISQQNRRIAYSTVGKMIHDVTRRAGLDKVVTQHLLRHSYVTERAAEGVPMAVIAYQVGHSSVAVTEKIYTHINSAHTRRSLAEHRRNG